MEHEELRAPYLVGFNAINTYRTGRDYITSDIYKVYNGETTRRRAVLRYDLSALFVKDVLQIEESHPRYAYYRKTFISIMEGVYDNQIDNISKFLRNVYEISPNFKIILKELVLDYTIDGDMNVLQALQTYYDRYMKDLSYLFHTTISNTTTRLLTSDGYYYCTISDATDEIYTLEGVKVEEITNARGRDILFKQGKVHPNYL